MIALFFGACSPSSRQVVDEFNDISYSFRYQNLDSTYKYAKKALSLASGYDDGKAAALNNLAFYHIAKMEYDSAYVLLDEVSKVTDNQIELLVADIQLMRLCQRESKNKDFYDYHEKATRRLKRIAEEEDNLSDYQSRRMVYARSEFHIVEATYFYYVGLEKPFIQSLESIDVEEIEKDTAQYLNYLYNMGAGGAITRGTTYDIAQQEFDYLLRCYAISYGKYPYWCANSMQAISEHLQSPDIRDYLIASNPIPMQYLNVEEMSDSLLAGNLAQRSLDFFTAYGDVYQIAGANRTLAQCFWKIGDYTSALICLNNALEKNKEISRAPDLVASIREELSLVYSAMNDKQQSDYNRNIYLDLQEQTRQDRSLEARAAQLDKTSTILNSMMIAVVVMIILVLLLLFVFDKMRSRNERNHSLDNLLEPLKEWKTRNDEHEKAIGEKREEIEESYQMSQLLIGKQRKRNLEQRAKVQLVNNITPFIDRMIHEVSLLSTQEDSQQQKEERYQYILELVEKINEYNDVLTRWIDMRQGELNLKIESFPLQPLFDILQKAKMTYQLKGVELIVKPTNSIVKADRILTLFMINTIADNARKFTLSGGKVEIQADEQPDCVEISIADTGIGMTEEQKSHLFDRTYTGGHGFGLLNCKGIIEKYKKISSIFNVCDIQAASHVGKGSRFTFRLPKGIIRVLLFLVSLVPMASFGAGAREQQEYLLNARQYADSIYASNVNGRYEQALLYADSARTCLNDYYQASYPNVANSVLMSRMAEQTVPAEIQWYRSGVKIPYEIILNIRNESAVAALALHQWDLYNANNNVYTQLFREYSSDNTLPIYVTTLQRSESNKNVAVVLLVLLLLSIFPAYFVLYYRYVLYRRFTVEKIQAINETLLSDIGNEEKLQKIDAIWERHKNLSSISNELADIVKTIREALAQSVEKEKDSSLNIEMATDELHRSSYEYERLHISNSVLDNCLSTLKHETMYYPPRIKQLITEHPDDVKSLRELVDYYKSLYDMLSEQAQQQVESNVRCDEGLINYLLEILHKISGETHLEIEPDENDPRYNIYKVSMPSMSYTEDQCRQLFTPLTVDVRYLVCKQIVREIGETKHMRRCGIETMPARTGINLRIILPK